MPPLHELRQRIGPELSDEEFLLRATMPAGQVDAMKAAGPAEQKYDPDMSPVMNLIRQLTARRDITYLSVEKQGFKLELRGQSARGGGVSMGRSNNGWKERLGPVEGFMFDLDGTLILTDRSLVGYRLLPGAVEILSELKSRGIPFVVLTNGSAYPAAEQGPEAARAGLAHFRRDSADALHRGGGVDAPPTREARAGLRDEGSRPPAGGGGDRDCLPWRRARGGSPGSLRRLASRVRNEGHRSRLQSHLEWRGALRRVRRAFLRDVQRQNDGLLACDRRRCAQDHSRAHDPHG